MVETIGRRRWFLRKSPLLADADAASIDALAEVTELQTLPRNRVLYLEGDPSSLVFLVHGGKVKTSSSGPDGRTITLGLHGAGSCVGELGLAGETHRNEAAVVFEPSNISMVPCAAWLELAATNPRLGLRLAAHLAAQRAALETRLIDGLRKGPARVAQVLLAHAEPVPGEAGRRRLHGFTQRDLADMVGMRRESLSSVLSDLERQGLLRRGRGIVLTDLARLGVLAGRQEVAHG